MLPASYGHEEGSPLTQGGVGDFSHLRPYTFFDTMNRGDDYDIS